MTELGGFLAGIQPDIDLDRAALQIAAIEFPGLDPQPSLDTLDAWAADLTRRLRGVTGGPEWVSIANRFLFEELGFRGNRDHYYNARNSCLNEVLRLRTGIPITLSLTYMEIARRLGVGIRGIGLPGHFLLQYAGSGFSTFIDPFHGGKLLTAAECLEIVPGDLRADVANNPSALSPVTKKQLLVRMLNNLRAIYLRAQATAHAAEVLRLMVLANPASPEERRQLGVMHIGLGKLMAAEADLQAYLRMAQPTPERAEAEEYLKLIHRRLATLN